MTMVVHHSRYYQCDGPYCDKLYTLGDLGGGLIDGWNSIGDTGRDPDYCSKECWAAAVVAQQ